MPYTKIHFPDIMPYIRVSCTTDNTLHHFLFLRGVLEISFLWGEVRNHRQVYFFLGYWKNFKTIFSVMSPLLVRLTLDRVQKKAAKFANHTNDSVWEALAQGRKVARICTLCKAYIGERAWQSIVDRLKGACYLSRDNHDREIGPGTKN
jgi:hypothetical protein